MVLRPVIVLVLVVAAASTAHAQDWARKMFSATSHNFGTVARGAKAEFNFEITNPFKEDVHLADVRSSCGCTKPRITQKTVKTWEKSAIVAELDTRSFMGDRTATLTVVIDKPYYAEVQLLVSAYIRSDVVLDPGVVALGEVEEGSGVERKVSVAYAGNSDWKITDVRSANPNFEVELNETKRNGGRVGYDMLVRLKPGAPAGFINDQLMIVTSDGSTRSVPVMVEGRVLPSLTVSPASLSMGVINPGETVTKQIVVKGKTPFKIKSVTCKDTGFKFETNDEAKPMHLIPVTFTAGPKGGKIVESISIETDDGKGGTLVATATVRDAVEGG